MLNRASLLSILIALAIASSASASRPLRVAFVADPQVDNPVELDYARRSAYKELRERKDLDLVVVLGDLVNDKPGLFAPTIASLDSLGCPWVAVPGNHDRDYGVRPRTLDSFKKYFGSVDTSFVKEGVRFILMNNIRYSGGREETGFSEAQKSWLASVLKTADGSRRTVLATHIPLSSAKAPFSDSLKTILDDCPDLLLVCGHTHNVFRHSLRLSGTREVEELTAGSLCGTWWRGPKDEEGIPYALQNCGAPKGYFVVDFGKKAYSMTYVPLGREKKAYSLTLLDDGALVLNVFGGSSEASVRLKVAGRWLDAVPYDAPAPEAQKVIEWNGQMTREFRKAHPELIIPMRKLRSPHCWVVRPESWGLGAVAPDGKPVKVGIDYSDPAMRLRARAFPEPLWSNRSLSPGDSAQAVSSPNL